MNDDEIYDTSNTVECDVIPMEGPMRKERRRIVGYTPLLGKSRGLPYPEPETRSNERVEHTLGSTRPMIIQGPEDPPSIQDYPPFPFNEGF